MRIQSRTKSKAVPEPSLAAPDILKLAQSQLARKGPFRFQMSGRSMQPTIRSGDWITVEAVKPEKVRPGDIVLLASASRTALVHRVVSLEARDDVPHVTTCGDWSEKTDVPVPTANVLGRVTTIEHNGDKIDLTTFWKRLQARFFGWKFGRRLRKAGVNSVKQPFGGNGR